MSVKYIFFYLFVNSLYLCGQQTAGPKHCLTRTRSYAKTLTEPQLSESEKNIRQLQLTDIATKLISDLLAYSQPEQIQIHLDQWENLKTHEFTMQTSIIDRIEITARTAQELAQTAARAYAQTGGLRSHGKLLLTNNTQALPVVLDYINAQLNYTKICNYLGITK